MSDFKVVGHSFSSRLDKEGDIKTTYKVTLENDDGDKMTKSSEYSDLLENYPMTSVHDIAVTSSPQTTLDEAIENNGAEKD